MAGKFMRGVGLAIALFTLGGCASDGPKFALGNAPMRPGMGRLVVYTQDTIALAQNTTKVRLDDRQVCVMHGDEAMSLDLPPGLHKIALDTVGTPGISVLSFAAGTGMTTYVSAGSNGKRMAGSAVLGIFGVLAVSDKSSPNGGHYGLATVSEDAARRDLDGLARANCPAS